MFGGLLPELIHYSFLNPSKTITSEKYAQQINEMHWKLKGLQPALIHRVGPVLLHDNAPPQVAGLIPHKLNELGYNVLSQLCVHLTSCQPTTTSSSILTTFCRENTSTTSRMQKILFKSSSYLEALIFFFFGYRSKQTYFSLAKMCWS